MEGEPTSRRSGRRPGAPDTRGAILAVARESFATRGYDATTIRGVAREAGVDPALVHHYFAGKHELFVRALGIPFDPELVVATALDGDVTDMGERLLRTFLGVWETPDNRARLTAFVRAVTANDQAAAMLRETFVSMLYERVAPHLDQSNARLRLNAVGSQIIGLAMVRYILRFEPMASADVEEVVRMVAPNIQRYLTGEI